MNLSSYLAMQKQLQQMGRAFRPTYLDMYQQMERSLEPFRQSHIALMQQIAAGSAGAHFQGIALANQRMLSGFDRIKIDTRWVDDLGGVHASWTKGIQPVQEQLAHIQARAKLSLTASFQMAAIAERLYASIDFARLQRVFRFQDDIAAQVHNRLAELSRGFDGLVQSVEQLPRLTSLPAFVMPSASREVLVTGHAVLELSPEDARVEDADDSAVLFEICQETSGAVELLSRINPALAEAYAEAYQGAREALTSGSVDRGRHMLISLRAMWDHLLWDLAPDRKVLPWVPSKTDEFIHNNKPTRKARVLYLCREINHGPLAKFVDFDTRALVKLLGLFQRVHELELGLTDPQLKALWLRSDSWLTFILQISQEGQEC